MSIHSWKEKRCIEVGLIVTGVAKNRSGKESSLLFPACFIASIYLPGDVEIGAPRRPDCFRSTELLFCPFLEERVAVFDDCVVLSVEEEGAGMSVDNGRFNKS